MGIHVWKFHIHHSFGVKFSFCYQILFYFSKTNVLFFSFSLENDSRHAYAWCGHGCKCGGSLIALVWLPLLSSPCLLVHFRHVFLTFFLSFPSLSGDSVHADSTGRANLCTDEQIASHAKSAYYFNAANPMQPYFRFAHRPCHSCSLHEQLCRSVSADSAPGARGRRQQSLGPKLGCAWWAIWWFWVRGICNVAFRT